MSTEYVAYIDEAKDEGFGKLGQGTSTGQSSWLALGAAIVSRDNDSKLPTWRNEVMALFPRKQNPDLHFRKLNHDQRVAVCKYLSEKPIGISVVASNKATILSSHSRDVFKRKGYLYNYLVRFLLERVTAECARTKTRRGVEGVTLKVVFSRRGGTNYYSMRDYLCLLRDGKERVAPVRSIDWTVLDPENIDVQNHSNRAGLQIADIITSATSSALEPNAFGNSEPRYALELAPRFCRLNSRIANRGLTILPRPADNPLTEDQKTFLQDLERRVRAPGS